MDELKKLRRIIEIKKIFEDVDIDNIIRTKRSIELLYDSIKMLVEEENDR